MKKWEKINNNYIISKKGFYISYNSDTSAKTLADPYGLSEVIGNLCGLDSGEETALVLKKTNSYYILEGDFRKEYEQHCRSLFEQVLLEPQPPRHSIYDYTYWNQTGKYW